MALSFRRNVQAITDDDARTWWTGDLLTALRAAAHLRSLVLASLGQLIPSVNKRPLSCAGMSPSSLAAGPVRVLLIADAVADGWLRIKRSRVRQSAPEGIRSRGQRLSPLAPDPIRCAVLPAVPSHWVPEEIPDRVRVRTGRRYARPGSSAPSANRFGKRCRPPVEFDAGLRS